VWDMNAAVSTGSFRIWLKDALGNWVRVTPKASPVPPVAVETHYEVSWSVTQAAGTYTLYVFYYDDSGAEVSRGPGPGTVTIKAP
jgi:hypothetical protein